MNFPVPADDNGRGIHGDSNCGNPQWREDLALAKQMGAKWYEVVAAGNNALEFCKALLDNGIMPVVRLWRDRPNPNSLPEGDRRAIFDYARVGVKYFETNNEPNLPVGWKWKHSRQIARHKMPGLNLGQGRFFLATSLHGFGTSRMERTAGR